MFRINRLKAIVHTEKGDFGFENSFDNNLNFIASFKNTMGKSSVIEVIFYCLGVEELIGGINDHVLKPVFRNAIKYEDKEITVLESKFYLEIQNDAGDIITIQRQGKGTLIKPTLITIYFGKLEDIGKERLDFEDMYVHNPGSATNQRGFHKYLETFIGWDLPEVPNYDDGHVKLYLQVLFSAFFVEQKKGWSGFLNTIPTKYGIKDPVKRAIEYILGLETLENEKKKIRCKNDENRIKAEWTEQLRRIIYNLSADDFAIRGLPEYPQVLDDGYKSKINIYKNISSDIVLSLSEYIESCENELEQLNTVPTMKIESNSKELELELLQRETECSNIESRIEELNRELLNARALISEYSENSRVLMADLQNNKDALKIRNMGSIKNTSVNKNICPTCHQHIDDTLLPQDGDFYVMSIEENIQHLEAQVKVMEFASERERTNIANLTKDITTLDRELIEKRRIIRSLKTDLYSQDENISETIIRKKILLENKIEKTNNIEQETGKLISEFENLSRQWKTLQSDKSKIPIDRFTEKDKEILKDFEDFFKSNLVDFGFSSTNPNEVQISKDTYLPVIDRFKLDYDASASDYIRAIWAFNTALLQASMKHGGNHCNVLIFDEPKQHSITPDHAQKFFDTFIHMEGSFQVIIGITLQNPDIIKTIEKIDKENASVRYLKGYAIQPLK